MDELIELKQLKANETSKLNILMNRLPQEPLEIPHGLTQTDFKFDIKSLQDLAETSAEIAKWQDGPNKQAALQGIVNSQDRLIAEAEAIFAELRKLGVQIGN